MGTPTQVAAEPDPRRWVSRLARVRRNVAVQDVLVTVFHSYLVCRALALGSGELARQAQIYCGALLAITVTAIALTRAELMRPGRLRGLLYRAGVVLPMPGSYVGLSYLFDAMQPELVDVKLWAVDQALFGGTPAVWLTRLNTYAINEWFSFFYQSYYPVLAACLLLPPLLDRGRRLQELMLGAAIVGAVGHVTYTLLPGTGPWVTIEFAEPVRGGFWWNAVRTTTEAEAVFDIFPSLHTGMPVFFTLCTFRYRKHKVYRWIWPLLAVVSGHIIVATMLLRWHWAIDIVAGIALAVLALMAGVAVSRREHAARLEAGRQPVWEPLRNRAA